jgi:hypothetical protein
MPGWRIFRPTVLEFDAPAESSDHSGCDAPLADFYQPRIDTDSHGFFFESGKQELMKRSPAPGILAF